jgi:hypothetical protein
MPARLAFFLKAVLAILLGLPAGCAFFSGQPALPRRAAIESQIAPEADDKYGPLVENADIIYFPAELVGPPQRSEPAWKLAEALHRHGRAFVVGWDAISAEEQSLLDQWAKQRAFEDGTVAQLRLFAAAGQRENCRAFLRESRKLGARFLALRKSPDPRAAGISAEEAAFQAEEFAADKIAEQFRERRSEKLLVFLPRRHLGSARGVPYLVAQKIKARQLVLDSREHPASRARLLAFVTHRGGISGRWLPGIARHFQIVNGAPGSRGDQP